MQPEQRTFVRDGVSVPLPVRTIDLHVSPDFSGRVVVYLQHGLVTDRRLSDDEHINTLSGFIELARSAGWIVTPPQTD